LRKKFNITVEEGNVSMVRWFADGEGSSSRMSDFFLEFFPVIELCLTDFVLSRIKKYQFETCVLLEAKQ
jgi:hypothetical protein